MKNDSKPLQASEQRWYQVNGDSALQSLHSRLDGLTEQEVAVRLEQFGPNRLPTAKRKPAWLRFAAHFNDVLIYILLAASVLTAYMGHWVDTAIIVGVALVNALIGFMQEQSAEKSLNGIRNMLSSQAHVTRSGALHNIDAENLVPGDIVSLRPGDRIPADLRLLEVHNLRVEEAILTGESTVVDKHAHVIGGEAQIGDRLNLAYSGTTVSSGTAQGVVIATGSATELGHINHMLGEVKAIQTPLLVQMHRLGKGIFYLIIAMMLALFVVGVVLHAIEIPELLMALISLAVASVPEGLPAIISIILSLGVQSMARQRAIIRSLPTVETLGAMTVICSDKTGTLTMNEMTVKAVIVADDSYSVSGGSYEPIGTISKEKTGAVISPHADPVLSRFISAVHLCNDSQLQQNEAGQWQIVGAPTAGALQVLAAKAGLNELNSPAIDKIPFDSSYKYQANLHELDGERMVLVTGAPDVLFAMATQELSNTGEQVFRREYWEREMARFAQKGLRAVAAAYKRVSADATELSHTDLHCDVVFLGIAAMMDPPRPEAIDAIATCREAGIAVKMITGDHPETAMAIGAMLGMEQTHTAITGAQLEAMSDEELIPVAQANDIFARTSPEHKLRLVKALQAAEHVVGMTGDGVNDAPALKQANVGIAMGIKGTEVTKEAADMVLTDDNFASIANAVTEGRRVYDNLKKTILFVLPTNLAQGLLIVIALLAGTTMPLTPLQILWMNMATSTTLAFGLAFEPAEAGLMQRKPRQTDASILDWHGLWRIGLVGLLIAGSAFWLESVLMGKGYGDNFIRTVLLQMLVTAQWVYMFNCRDQVRFSLNRSMFKNMGLWISSAILLVLQLAIVYSPTMNRVFGTEPLPLYYWIITLGIALSIFAIIEVEKVVIRWSMVRTES